MAGSVPPGVAGSGLEAPGSVGVEGVDGVEGSGSEVPGIGSVGETGSELLLGDMTRVNSVLALPAAFVAVAVTRYVPLVSGVPLMMPVLLHVKPLGRPDAVQVMGVVPVADRPAL